MRVSLTVGKVDAGVAVLLTEDKRLIEFPSILLPPSIQSGSIVDINVSQNHNAEQQSHQAFSVLQQNILNKYGLEAPAPPVLRLRNATQTSIVLEWDPIVLATSTLRSLALYRNGSKAGNIPRPLDMLSTKMSGLSLNTEYSFFLVLRTTGGTYTSNTLTVRTHEMTNLTGITVTPGVLPGPLREALESAVDRIGAKLVDQVRIDTTHFVCTEPRGDGWQKAVDTNIPVVRPEWVEGCEREGKIVGVRGYYLDADPKLRQVGTNPAIQHQSRESMARDLRGSTAERRDSAQPSPAVQVQSQTSLPSRGPRSPENEEVGEPGPTVEPTPTIQQKELPPDPPRQDKDEDDESEEDERPEDQEKQRGGLGNQAEADSEEDSETENQQPELHSNPTRKADAEDEKGSDMEEVAL